MAARAGNVHSMFSMDWKPNRKGGARPRPKYVPQGPPFSITVDRVLIASFCTFCRFANINVHVYYRTVRGRLSQLLDLQFGLI